MDETYTANAMGRLSAHEKLVNSNTTTTSYRYDHTGIQTALESGGVTRSHLIDSRNPTGYAQRVASIHSSGGSDTVTRRVFGDDLLYESGTLSHHLLYDGQGTDLPPKTESSLMR